MIASAQGGVNIEDVAAKNPDAIIKVPIDINEGFTNAKAKEAAKKLGFPDAKLDEVAEVFVNLYNMFVSKDATMVEINPFAEDSNGTCKKILFEERNMNENCAIFLKIFVWMPKFVSMTMLISDKKIFLLSVTGARRIHRR